MRFPYIDWLRSIAILLLIPYHVAFYYSDSTYPLSTKVIVEPINYLFYLLYQWRLCLLFFVSGICAEFALNKYGRKTFLKARIMRILIPLFLSSILFVMPIIYLEKLKIGAFTGSIFSFFPQFFNGIYPYGNLSWGHLWFLFYLFFYSLIYLIFYNRLKNLKLPWVFLLFPILVEGILRVYYPGFPNFITDYTNLLVYGFYFLLGTKILSSPIGDYHPKGWHLLIAGIWFFLLPIAQKHLSLRLFSIADGINSLLTVLISFALAKKYLNFKNKLIKYLSSFDLPLYIIHQTVLTILAWYLIPHLNPYLFFIINCILTLIISIVVFELMKRFTLGRVVLGVKKNT